MSAAAFGALCNEKRRAERQQDRRFALIAYVTVTAMGQKRRDDRDWLVEDFMPGGREEREQSPEEMIAILREAGRNVGSNDR